MRRKPSMLDLMIKTEQTSPHPADTQLKEAQAEGDRKMRKVVDDVFQYLSARGLLPEQRVK